MSDMSDLLDRFVVEVASRTSDAGVITKAELSAAFSAATAEDAPRDLHDDDPDFDALYAAMAAATGVTAHTPGAQSDDDREYAAMAAATGVMFPASLRRAL